MTKYSSYVRRKIDESTHNPLFMVKSSRQAMPCEPIREQPINNETIVQTPRRDGQIVLEAGAVVGQRLEDMSRSEESR